MRVHVPYTYISTYVVCTPTERTRVYLFACAVLIKLELLWVVRAPYHSSFSYRFFSLCIFLPRSLVCSPGCFFCICMYIYMRIYIFLYLHCALCVRRDERRECSHPLPFLLDAWVGERDEVSVWVLCCRMLEKSTTRLRMFVRISEANECGAISHTYIHILLCGETPIAHRNPRRARAFIHCVLGASRVTHRRMYQPNCQHDGPTFHRREIDLNKTDRRSVLC